MSAADRGAERDPRLFAYLLGRLEAQEREELEQRYFAEDEVHEQVRDAADALIRSYLEGTLSAEDHEGFETHFLASPARRERVRLMRALLMTADRPAPPRSGGRPALWALAAALILTLAAALLLLRPGPPPSRQARTEPPTAQPRPASPTAEARAEPAVVRLGPAPGEATEVALAESAPQVRFEVLAPDRRPTYDAVLTDGAGKEVWRRAQLIRSRAGGPLVFSVPATVLKSGEYLLTLRGEALRGEPGPPSVTRYPLRVHRLP